MGSADGGGSLAALALSGALGGVLATLASSPASPCPGALTGTQCPREGSPVWFLARSSEHLLYCDDGSPVLPPEAPLNWGKVERQTGPEEMEKGGRPF